MQNALKEIYKWKNHQKKSKNEKFSPWSGLWGTLIKVYNVKDARSGSIVEPD